MKKFFKKLSLATLGLIGTLSATFGFAACNPGSKEVKDPEPSGTDTNKTYTSTLKEAPKDGSTPMAHTVEDNLYYVAYTLSQQTQYHAYAECTSLASIANQITKTWKDYKNGTMICSDLTYTSGSSLIQAGTQACFASVADKEGNGTHSEVFMRSAKSTVTADSTPTNLVWDNGSLKRYQTEADYQADYGSYSTELSVYLLYHDSIDWEKSSQQVTNNGDGTYSINYVLNPELAGYYYGNAMQTRGGLKTTPNFKSIEISFTFDSQWRVLSSYCEEVAEIIPKAAGGIKTTSTSKTTTTFSYDESNFDNEHFAFYDNYYATYVANPDSVGSGSEETPSTTKLDALTLLGNGLSGVMTEQGEQFDVNVTIGNTTYNGYIYLALDINKLASDPYNAVVATLTLAKGRNPQQGDLFIQYKNGKVDAYLSKDFYLSADVAELVGLQTALTQAQSTLDAGESSGTDILGDLFNKMVVTEGVGKATITLQDSDLFGTGIGVDIRMNFTVSDNDEIAFIDAMLNTLTYNDSEIEFAAVISPSSDEVVTFNPEELPVNINDFMGGLNGLFGIEENDLLAVNLTIDGNTANFAQLKGFEANVKAFIDPNGNTVSGTLSAQYTTALGTTASLTLSVWYKNAFVSGVASDVVCISLSELNGVTLTQPLTVECRLSDASEQLTNALSNLLIAEMNGGIALTAEDASESSSDVSANTPNDTTNEATSADISTIAGLVQGFLNTDWSSILTKVEVVNSHVAVIVDLDGVMALFNNKILSSFHFGTAAANVDWREGAEHTATLSLNALGLTASLDVDKNGASAFAYPTEYSDVETFLTNLDEAILTILGQNGENVNTFLTIVDDNVIGALLANTNSAYSLSFDLRGDSSNFDSLKGVSVRGNFYFENEAEEGTITNRIRAIRLEDLTIEGVISLKADLVYDGGMIFVKLYSINGVDFTKNESAGLGVSVTVDTVYDLVEKLVDVVFNTDLLKHANSVLGFYDTDQDINIGGNNANASAKLSDVLNTLLTFDYETLFSKATIVKDENGNILSVRITLDNEYLASAFGASVAEVGSINVLYTAESGEFTAFAKTTEDLVWLILSGEGVESDETLAVAEDCFSVEYIMNLVNMFSEEGVQGIYTLFNMEEGDLLALNYHIGGNNADYKFMRRWNVDVNTSIAPNGKAVTSTLSAEYTSILGTKASIILSVYYKNAEVEGTTSNLVCFEISELNGAVLEKPLQVECNLTMAQEQITSALQALFGNTEQFATLTAEDVEEEGIDEGIAYNFPSFNLPEIKLPELDYTIDTSVIKTLIKNFIAKLDYNDILQRVEVADSRVGITVNLDSFIDTFDSQLLSYIKLGTATMEVDLSADSEHKATLAQSAWGLEVTLDVDKNGEATKAYPEGAPNIQYFIAHLNDAIKTLLGHNGENMSTAIAVLDDDTVGRLFEDNQNGYAINVVLNGNQSGISALSNVQLKASLYLANETVDEETNRVRSITIDKLQIGDSISLKLGLLYTEKTLYVKLYEVNGTQFFLNGNAGLGFSMQAATVYNVVEQLVDMIFNSQLFNQVTMLLPNVSAVSAVDLDEDDDSLVDMGGYDELAPAEQINIQSVLSSILNALMNVDYSSIIKSAAIQTNMENGSLVSASLTVDLDTIASAFGVEESALGNVKAEYNLQTKVVTLTATATDETVWFTLVLGDSDSNTELVVKDDCISLDFITSMVSDLVNTATDAQGNIYTTYTYTGTMNVSIASLYNISMDIATFSLGEDENGDFYVSMLAHLNEAVIGIKPLPTQTLTSDWNIAFTYSNGYITLGREVGTANAKYKVMTMEYLLLNMFDSESPIRWLLGTSKTLWNTISGIISSSMGDLVSEDKPTDVDAIWQAYSAMLASDDEAEAVDEEDAKTFDLTSYITAFDFKDAEGNVTNIFGNGANTSNLTLAESYYALNLNLGSVTNDILTDVRMAINRSNVTWNGDDIDGVGFFGKGISLYTSVYSVISLNFSLTDYLEGVTPEAFEADSTFEQSAISNMAAPNFYNSAVEKYNIDFTEVTLAGADSIAICYSSEDNSYTSVATQLHEYTITVERPDGSVESYQAKNGATVILADSDLIYIDGDLTYYYYYTLNGELLGKTFKFDQLQDINIACNLVTYNISGAFNEEELGLTKILSTDAEGLEATVKAYVENKINTITSAYDVAFINGYTVSVEISYVDNLQIITVDVTEALANRMYELKIDTAVENGKVEVANTADFTTFAGKIFVAPQANVQVKLTANEGYNASAVLVNGVAQQVTIEQNESVFTATVTMANTAATVSAQFALDLTDIAVTFYGLDPTDYKASEVTYLKSEEISAPAKDGYIFLGWAVKNGEAYSFTTATVEEGATYYAVWAVARTEVTAITVATSGTTLPTSGTFASNTTLAGWYTDTTFATSVTELTNPEQIVVARMSYTVSFKFSGKNTEFVYGYEEFTMSYQTTNLGFTKVYSWNGTNNSVKYSSLLSNVSISVMEGESISVSVSSDNKVITVRYGEKALYIQAGATNSTSQRTFMTGSAACVYGGANWVDAEGVAVGTDATTTCATLTATAANISGTISLTFNV